MILFSFGELEGVFSKGLFKEYKKDEKGTIPPLNYNYKIKIKFNDKNKLNFKMWLFLSTSHSLYIYKRCINTCKPIK